MVLETSHYRGVLFALVGALAFTPDALLVRLADVDAFTLAAGRMSISCLAITLGMFLYFGFKRAVAEFSSLGRLGFLASILQAVSCVLFAFSISNTSAANCLLLFASMPLFAALLGWLILGHKPIMRTWLAIFSAGLAILVITAGNLGGGHIGGDMLALVNAITTALFYIVAHKHTSISFIPANAVGCGLGAAMMFPFATFSDLGAPQSTALIADGLFVLPVAIVAFTLALRELPAAEVSLIGLLEVVLGPMLVFAVLGEPIAIPTLVGGGILLLTLSTHIILAMKDERQQGSKKSSNPELLAMSAT